MDEKKICFIIYKEKKINYSDNLAYIKELNVPDGMQMECLSVEGSESRFLAYSEGTEASDAKYKIYIDDNTYIINKNIIYDILNIFNGDKRISVIGLVGQKGVSTQEKEAILYGKKIIDHCESGVNLKQFCDTQNLTEEVDYIEQTFIATTGDIRWGIELCQAQDEFLELKFEDNGQRNEKMVVARQIKPWCYKAVLV